MKRLCSLILMSTILTGTTVSANQGIQTFGSGASGMGSVAVSVKASEDVGTDVSAVNSDNQVCQLQPEQVGIPPSSAALDPRRLIRFFCRMWKDENYVAMYGCMDKQYRSKVTVEKFASLFEADAERTGGLEDENILAEDGENAAGHLLVVDLRFRKKKAAGRRVRALLEKTKDGYRIIQSGILPLDFNNL